MALELGDGNQRLITKTLFHKPDGSYVNPVDFIKSEIVAGNVLHQATLDWLKKIVNFAD